MSTETPLAGYGTHLRKSRDQLLLERDEARVGQQMAEHANERLVARVELLEAENKALLDRIKMLEIKLADAELAVIWEAIK